MNTNNKQVIKTNQNHILNYYTLDEFKQQVKAMNQYGSYNAIKEMVQGGCFLIYNGDIKKYLMETLNETEQDANKYDTTQQFNLYCHLLARDGAKLLNK